jgi:hypothetical protein
MLIFQICKLLCTWTESTPKKYHRIIEISQICCALGPKVLQDYHTNTLQRLSLICDGQLELRYLFVNTQTQHLAQDVLLFYTLLCTKDKRMIHRVCDELLQAIHDLMCDTKVDMFIFY